MTRAFGVMIQEIRYGLRSTFVLLKQNQDCRNTGTITSARKHPGALLRMNRSIQAEGTFGIMKNDRWYKRIVRRGIKSVLLEVFLVSIGHNLYKYHNKQKKVAAAA